MDPRPARFDLVPLPRVKPPLDARLVRLRLADRPGMLATVASVLAAHGVDILRIEVLGREGGLAIDDLLLAGAGIDGALAELADSVSVLADRADADLPDPALAMGAACAEVAFSSSRRDAKRRLLRAALGLVFADAGFVLEATPAGWLIPVVSTTPGLSVVDPPSLAHSALAAEHALAADSRAPWAPPAFRAALPQGSVVVVPAGGQARLVIGLVREDDAPFVAPERERLEALARMAGGVVDAHDARGRVPVPTLEWVGARLAVT